MDMPLASRFLRGSPARSTTIAAEDWQPTLRLTELWQYRELFYFFVWRDIKVRYAQSVLGLGWAIIQPLFPMVVFTIVFGKVAGIRSDGVPYALFAFAALVPWTYFSNALGDASQSLVKEVNMLSKIYFPRLIIPLTSIIGRLVDLAVAFVLLLVLVTIYGASPTWSVLALPLLIGITAIAACGLGLWLSALALQYRDVRFAVPFAIQLLMYVAPVVYPTSLVSEPYRYVYALNPMVGVIEGFRASLLGARPMPWDFIGIGAVTAGVLLYTGTVYFLRKEPVFADVG
jgi:lipopolysaccharide transport system permease protein